MMDGDCFLRMYRFANGFTVEIKDPAIVKFNVEREKKNQSSKGSTYIPYKDPWRSFVFDTAAKAQAFISKNIDKAIVAAKAEDNDEYGTAFDMAASTPEKAA